MQYLHRLERVILVSTLLSMVALFSLNVLAREVGGTFASQLAWVDEAVRLMNIFLVFSALGLALEKGRHVGIDTLKEMLPNTARNTLRKTVDAVGCIFCAYMTYLAYLLVVFVLGTGQRSPTLDIPIGWLYMAPIMGFGLLSLRYFLSLVSVINRYDSNEENTSTFEGA